MQCNSETRKREGGVSGPRGTRAGCTGVKHWREPKKVQQMGEDVDRFLKLYLSKSFGSSSQARVPTDDLSHLS
jgi:hypothetical protein